MSVKLHAVRVPIKQILRKVPARLIVHLLITASPECVGTASFDINLRKHGKCGLVFGLDASFDLSFSLGFLATELVAWEGKNLQTFV